MDWGESWRKANLKYLLFDILLLLLPILRDVQCNSFQISKREAALVQIIQETSLTLDIQKFYFDPVMVQNKPYTEYTYPRLKEGGNLIFLKMNSDSNKDSIALSSVESGFAIVTPRGDKKRQFVLLRKSLFGRNGPENMPYMASFVYVRSLLENDTTTNIFEINGIKNVVEWDIWESRAKGFYAGWGICDFTFMFTCEALLETLDQGNKNADQLNQMQIDWAKKMTPVLLDNDSSVPAHFIPPLQYTPIVAEDDYSANEFNDLYLDLDFHRIEDHAKVQNKTKEKAGTEIKKENRKKRSLIGKRRFKRDDEADGKADNDTGAYTPGENVLKAVNQAGGSGGDADKGINPGVLKLLGSSGDEEATPEGRTMSSDGDSEGGAVGGLLQGAVGLLKGVLGGSESGGGGLGGLLQGGMGLLKGALGGLEGSLGNLGGLLGGLVGGLLGGGGGGGSSPQGRTLSDGGGQSADNSNTTALTKLVGSLGGLNPLALLGRTGAGGAMSEALKLGTGAPNTKDTSSLLDKIIADISGGGKIDNILDRMAKKSGATDLTDRSGIKASVDGLTRVFGNLEDVDVNTLADALLDITSGCTGSLKMIENMINNGLGSGSSIKTIVQGSTAKFEKINEQMKVLATELSGANLITGLKRKKDQISRRIANVISIALSGKVKNSVESKLPDIEDVDPLVEVQKYIGPIAASLNPADAIILSSNAIIRGLSGLGAGMGYGYVTQSLPNLFSSLKAEGVLSTVGLSLVPKLVPGLSDTIDSIGESILSPSDFIGKAIVDGARTSLIKVGFSVEHADLMTIGSHLACVMDNLQAEGMNLAVRQLSYLAGVTLNAAGFRSAGAGKGTGEFRAWQKIMNNRGMRSNAHTVFGVTYPGAGNLDFFFPKDSLIRAMFKTTIVQSKPILGYLKPGGALGRLDAFYPDDPLVAEQQSGEKGVMTPLTYKQPNRDANNGVVGTYIAPSMFIPDAMPQPAIYKFSHNLFKNAPYWLPPMLDVKRKKRHEISPQRKRLIYGYLFHGISESPHVFVAEGDALSGYFVPYDEEHPHYKETPHGVLIPHHPAGHAKFILDESEEMRNAREVRGVFLPDAMYLAGGIGGKLSRNENGTFNFILDHPAVDFVFIKDHPSTKDVWAAFLSKDEWKYTPPPIPLAARGNNIHIDQTRNMGADKLFFGVKVITMRTSAFLPENFAVEGIYITAEDSVPKKIVAGTLTTGPLNTPWEAEITGGAMPNTGKPMTVLFIPTGFPKGDAIIGKFTFNGGSNGRMEISEQQLQVDYFLHDSDELWVPPEFFNKKVQAASLDDDLVIIPPEKPPNYYFGPSYEPSPEMEENLLNDLPRELNYGFYYIEKESPEPLFIAETGSYGIFKPFDTSLPERKGFFFPERPNLRSSFIIEGSGVVVDGTEGTFQTISKKKEASTGHITVTFDSMSETLEIPKTTEILAGWKHATTRGSSSMPATVKTKVKEEYLKGSKKSLKYRLVGVRGGFVGVTMEGPEAFDDPNNPIFQRYLHYKAHRDGNVNPFGSYMVLDPVTRESTPDGRFGLGELKTVLQRAPKNGDALLKSFSVQDWEFPLVKSVMEGQNNVLTIGGRKNIVNMMDFRMYALRKYKCKRAVVAGKWVKLMVPNPAEANLHLKSPAKTKGDWLKKLIKNNETLAIPRDEATLGCFSRQYNLNPSGLASALGLDGKPDAEWTKDAGFNRWGDEHRCDEIILNELGAADATEQHTYTGMDLGIRMISTIGKDLSYPSVARKLLMGVSKKRKGKPPGTILERLGTTDLLGTVDMALTNFMAQKNTAKSKPDTDSGEENSQKSRRRKKRDAPKGGSLQLIDSVPVNHPGWKTQFQEDVFTDDVTILDSGLIFYGLGNCKRDTKKVNLFELQDPEQIIDYYLKILRIDCMHLSKPRVIELFNDNYLSLAKDRSYFELSRSNTVLNQERLTPLEMRKVSLAFELYAFTKTYRTLRKKGFASDGFLTDAQGKVTRSIGFFTELVMYYIRKARRVCPTHTVRLHRNLLKTLRTVLTKLHQDSIALEKRCATGCLQDKMLTNEDKYRIVALIQFIIHGMGPANQGRDSRDIFNAFLELNRKSIQERLEEFERQYAAQIVLIELGGA